MKYILFWTPEFYSVAYGHEVFDNMPDIQERVKELKRMDGGPDCLDLDYEVYMFRPKVLISLGMPSTPDEEVNKVLAVLNSRALTKISIDLE